jgi:hypothetical protein
VTKRHLPAILSSSSHKAAAISRIGEKERRGMISQSDQNRVLGQLASAFWHTGYNQLSKDIEACEGKKVEDVVQTLAKIEGEEPLPTPLRELVVRAQGVIAGDVELEKFVVESLTYQGLI